MKKIRRLDAAMMADGWDADTTGSVYKHVTFPLNSISYEISVPIYGSLTFDIWMQWVSVVIAASFSKPYIDCAHVIGVVPPTVVDRVHSVCDKPVSACSQERNHRLPCEHHHYL